MTLYDYWPIIVCTFIGQLLAGVLSVCVKHLLDFRLRRKFITHYSPMNENKHQLLESEYQGCNDTNEYGDCACCHETKKFPLPPPVPKLDPEDLYDFGKGKKNE